MLSLGAVSLMASALLRSAWVALCFKIARSDGPAFDVVIDHESVYELEVEPTTYQLLWDRQALVSALQLEQQLASAQEWTSVRRQCCRQAWAALT